MVTHVHRGLALAALVLAAPSAAFAQAPGEQPKEFGVDAGLTIGFGDLESTVISLPAQNFRIGFFQSPSVSIEPFGSLNYYNFGGGDDVTQLGVGVGMLYHMRANRRQSPYVRPFAELAYISGDGSNTQFSVGSGLGMKFPWRTSFAWRMEANLGYAFKTGDLPGGLRAGANFGMSFLTF